MVSPAIPFSQCVFSSRGTPSSPQPFRLDLKRRLTARSDRVKCCDLHPTEPWMLASLYNGNVHVWNYENQTLVKSFEVSRVGIPG